MRPGCSMRLSTPPRLSASENRWQRSSKRRASSRVPAQHGGDDAAVAARHLPLRERVLRMALQARVVHALDLRVRLAGTARSRARCAQCRSMRSASVLMPRSVRNESNGPGHAPERVLQVAEALRAAGCRRARSPRRPTQSEWPFRYLVVECTTISKPCSSGRWMKGVAKVLSQTLISPCCARNARPQPLRSTSLQQRIGRRLHPDQPRVGPDRRLQRVGLGQVDERHLRARRSACARSRAAGSCRRRDRAWR